MKIWNLTPPLMGLDPSFLKIWNLTPSLMELDPFFMKIWNLTPLSWGLTLCYQNLEFEPPSLNA